MNENPVTRGEFDMLVQQVNGNYARLEAIDQGGTRGVGVLQSQLMDVKGDLTRLETKFDAHEKEHQRTEADRRSSRRWAVGWALAALIALEGPMIALLVNQLHH
jgi:hypothetical protein